METELTIIIAGDDSEESLSQANSLKNHLSDFGLISKISRAPVGPDEAGGELLPILTVVAPIAVEVVKLIGEWIKSRPARKKVKPSGIKIKIRDKNGKEIELDVSNIEGNEKEVMEKISKILK
jgi:hypothetical protein